jgi:hypothetical protein
MIRYVVCAAIIGSIACSSPAGPVEVATTPDQSIRMSNGTNAPIYYFAIDANALALANWAPCTDPVTCPNVQPGKARLIPFSEIALYSPETAMAVVYWWHLKPQGEGTFAPDSIRALQVSLVLR